MKPRTSRFFVTAVLFVGLAVFGFGLNRIVAQSPSPLDTCGDYDGNECTSGRFCILGFCWDWETQWPAPGEEEECDRVTRQWGICTD